MNLFRAAAIAATTVVAAGTLGACGTTASDLPLPGTSMPGDTYEITATFDDALNLASGAPVKLDGVAIGRVDEITVKDLKAVVTMDISTDTKLATTSDFRLRATTALGELFVDVVDDPAGQAKLTDGSKVSAELTSSAPTVEDTLTAASLFINGGGLGQIQTIVNETNAAVGGREDTLRDVLQRVNSTATAVNAMSSDIDSALTALSNASEVLSSRQDTIDRALTEIGPAAEVLNQNTAALVDLLSSIDTFGDVVVPTIAQTRDDISQMAAQAGPVFAEVAAVEPRLADGVAQVMTFVEALNSAVPGVYLNTHLKFRPLNTGLGDTSVLGITSTTADTSQDSNAVADLTQVPLISALTGQGSSSSSDTALTPLLSGLTGGGN
ncbi:MAG: MCE family protein [Aeromicrobium sp.]|uniref:MCE family protein n=1 Tax=Aeromicrobium sp. TaxID=1871063 RepID=UPI0039E31DB3